MSEAKLQERYEAAVADLGIKTGSLEAQLLWDYTRSVQESLASASEAAGQAWVDSKKELPDIATQVLACCDDGEDFVVAKLNCDAEIAGHGEPYWETDGGDLALCNYPFWMPLPEPPSKPEDGG